MSQLHRFEHRPCVLESSLSSPMLFHSWFIFLQQCVALDWYLVGVSLSFLGHLFLQSSLGV